MGEGQSVNIFEIVERDSSHTSVLCVIDLHPCELNVVPLGISFIKTRACIDLTQPETQLGRKDLQFYSFRPVKTKND